MAMVSSSRRERFTHRKEGTGRVASSRPFDLRGQRTGWEPPKDVRKDEHGFDDMDAFFAPGTSAPSAAPAPAAALDTTQRALDFSRTSPGQVLDQMPELDGPMYSESADAGVADAYDESQPVVAATSRRRAQPASDADDDPEPRKQEKPRRAASKPKKLAASKPVRAASDVDEDRDAHSDADADADDDDEFRRHKKVKKSAASRKAASKPAPRPRHVARDDVSDEDDDAILHGEDLEALRHRPSLGTGHHDDGGRYPRRRRWKAMDHAKGEHIVYNEFGAVTAVREGVLTPELEMRKRAAKVARPPGDFTSSKRSRSKEPEDRSRHRSVSNSRGGSKDRARDAGKRRDRDRDGDRERDRSEPKEESRKRRRSATPETGDRRASVGIQLTAQELEQARRGTKNQRELSPERLPAGFKEARSPTLTLPGPTGKDTYQIAVFRQAKHLAFEKLPVTMARPKEFEKPAQAAAAFDSTIFISGTVRLRPHAMKDEESTHNCTQVFTIIACQPKALQVTIAGQSYLAAPGDHFYVPPSKTYSMMNHSPHTEAEISFVVVKPSTPGDV